MVDELEHYHVGRGPVAGVRLNFSMGPSLRKTQAYAQLAFALPKDRHIDTGLRTSEFTSW